MRSLLALLPAVSLALCALVGCNETDPEALYIDALYQLRCIDCEPRTNDGRSRDIHHLDGDQGFDLSCVTESTSDGRLISFLAEYTDPSNEAEDYAFQIDQAGLDDTARRAFTFETGIRNSGLGLLILLGQFKGLGGAALITAGWGVWHLISGGALAAWWSQRPPLSLPQPPRTLPSIEETAA